MSGEDEGPSREDDAGHGDPDTVPVPQVLVRPIGTEKEQYSAGPSTEVVRQSGNLRREIRVAEWVMIAFTAITAVATWAAVYVSNGQLREMQASSNQTDQIISLQKALERDERSQAAYTNNLATYTNSLAGIGKNELSVTGRTADAAVNGNRIQGENFEADERPWVEFSRDACPPGGANIIGTQSDGRMYINFCYKNFGKEPARDVVMHPYMAVSGEQLTRAPNSDQTIPTLIPSVAYGGAVVAPHPFGSMLERFLATTRDYGIILPVDFKYKSPAGNPYESWICLAPIYVEGNQTWKDCHPDAIQRTSAEIIAGRVHFVQGLDSYKHADQ